MYSQILTGNLVADATCNKTTDSEKYAINFTVAINFSEDHTEFCDFVYWRNTSSDNSEPKIVSYLKKGVKVCVKSSFYKTTKYKGQDDVTYTKKQYSVSELEFYNINKENPNK